MDTQTPAGADAGTPGPTPGTGPGPHPGTTPPPAPHPFWVGVRRTGLYRSDDRWVGGVAGGLAERVGVDPLIVRGLLAVTALIGGLGLVLYGVAWALLPDARDNRILLERLGAGDANGALIGSLAFVVVGFARGDGWWWFWDGGGALGGLLWLACVAGLVVLVVTAVQRHNRGSASWQPPGAVPPPGVPRATAGGPPYGPPFGPPFGPHFGPPHAGPPHAGAWAHASTAPTAPLPTTGGAPATSAGDGAPTPPYPPAPPYGYQPVPPAPPAPPRPPRRSADGATIGAVVGLSVVGLGVLLLLDRTGAYDGPVWLTAGGLALALAGLGIVTLGLRGRTSGFVGFLAVVAALVWVPLALVHQTEWEESVRSWDRADDEIVVTSRTVASDGFDVSAGALRLDLTSVPLTDDELRVPISLGAGQLTVVVPAEAAVQADITTGMGSIRWELDGEVREQSGVGLSDVTFQDDDATAGSPDLVLEISSGVGEVRIIEEAGA
ncbi:PspC domain-containing protein [Cellulomonas sp. S1-8]|uniref:PspC domain-containing protein n=1 Tax=Cellulomonas sp. S1-8 TaxID=2904790 RepID=UPI002243F927|nr:PspC domain-containing protein [Cellulomonas sp. S1-8]UZN02135.1 PspC domain-containing protein [Cellulomonas sp. S1-8]